MPDIVCTAVEEMINLIESKHAEIRTQVDNTYYAFDTWLKACIQEEKVFKLDDQLNIIRETISDTKEEIEVVETPEKEADSSMNDPSNANDILYKKPTNSEEEDHVKKVLNSMKVWELVSVLKRYNCPSRGKRVELIERAYQAVTGTYVNPSSDGAHIVIKPESLEEDKQKALEEEKRRILEKEKEEKEQLRRLMEEKKKKEEDDERRRLEEIEIERKKKEEEQRLFIIKQEEEKLRLLQERQEKERRQEEERRIAQLKKEEEERIQKLKEEEEKKRIEIERIRKLKEEEEKRKVAEKQELIERQKLIRMKQEQDLQQKKISPSSVSGTTLPIPSSVSSPVFTGIQPSIMMSPTRPLPPPVTTTTANTILSHTTATTPINNSTTNNTPTHTTPTSPQHISKIGPSSLFTPPKVPSFTNSRFPPSLKLPPPVPISQAPPSPQVPPPPADSKTPLWIEKPYLDLFLKRQFGDGRTCSGIDPYSIFGPIKTCDLDEIFPDVKNKRDFNNRGSSGNWMMDEDEAENNQQQ
ncbi:hypothetical protein WA158_001047 [Blastocystis sp. Blastoise]